MFRSKLQLACMFTTEGMSLVSSEVVVDVEIVVLVFSSLVPVPRPRYATLKAGPAPLEPSG